MKIAIISFHKNLGRYPTLWIEKYKNSILNQTRKDFDIFELNYGGGDERIFKSSNFESIEMNDHAQAHNYLLHQCLNEYDLVLNTNVDDYYPLNRVEIQTNNYDPEIEIISGNYETFSDSQISIYKTKFHLMNIHEEFKKGHNIIAHPACAYTKKILKHNEFLRSNEIPADDFNMWKRLLNKGAQFKILPDLLLYYRISDLKTKL